MTAPPPSLGLAELTAAGGILVLAGATGVALGLGLARNLAVAAVRMVFQLLLVGMVLRSVFSWQAPVPVVLVGLAMTAAAARAAVARTRRAIDGMRRLAFLTLLASAGLIATLGSAGVLGIRPWWRPEIWIPLIGMVLGNSLTGIALAVDTCLEGLTARRREVELRLALGATRTEATRDLLAASVRAGSLPIVNSMAVCGVVSLPGMFTGQVLAGADPVEAVRYQIVIMCLIAAATTLGATLFTLLVLSRVFDDADRLHVDRIRSREG